MNVESILKLLSGIALFLFGMSLMGDSLKLVAGNKLEMILYKLTGSPIKGFIFGFSLSAFILTYNYKGIILSILYTICGQLLNLIVVLQPHLITSIIVVVWMTCHHKRQCTPRISRNG